MKNLIIAKHGHYNRNRRDSTVDLTVVGIKQVKMLASVVKKVASGTVAVVSSNTPQSYISARIIARAFGIYISVKVEPSLEGEYARDVMPILQRHDTIDSLVIVCGRNMTAAIPMHMTYSAYGEAHQFPKLTAGHAYHWDEKRKIWIRLPEEKIVYNLEETP